MPHVIKKILLAQRTFFYTSISRSLSKTAVWTKTNLFSHRSLLLFSTKITPNFFTRFISRFKNHSNKIDLKKGLFQYSSSSRKKRQSTKTIQFLDCKKTKRRPIIAPAIAVRLLKIKPNSHKTAQI